MFKYYSDLPIITNKVNFPVNGIVTVSKELEGFKLVEEKKPEPKEIERDLNKEALELGIEGDELAKFKRKNKQAKIKYIESYEA